MSDPLILLKYYSPNIPSEDYAVYSKIQLIEVLPLLSKLKPDYSNFPKGEQLTREQFDEERIHCVKVRSNASGEIWEYGNFLNEFKLKRDENRRLGWDN